MLSPNDHESAPDACIEERVRRVIIETAGWLDSGPLLGASLDSLTLIAIVTRLEAAFAIAFDSDETAALLGARDSSELAALVARKVAAQHANLDELARNDGC
jgi:hypothetical protein